MARTPSPGRLRLLRERPRDDAAVEAMNEAAFGPDRQHKTVYRLREDVKPIKELCFVAIDHKGRMVASIRNWPILINERWPAILLGPLAIAPELRGLGYGKALMWHAMAQSRMLGHSRILLVGDPEYYNQFGFRRRAAALGGCALPIMPCTPIIEPAMVSSARKRRSSTQPGNCRCSARSRRKPNGL